MTDMPIDTTTDTGSVLTITTAPISMIMVQIDPDGNHVRIDWKAVESTLAGNDPMLKAIAQALLAVRDKTYEPMGKGND